MAIRAVLFDWDGTLVHNPATGWPATSLTRYLRRELGIGATEDAFTAGFRATVREHQRERSHAWPPIAGLLREAFARLGWPASEKHVDCCAELFFNDLHRDTSVFDDARALLASLKFRGYRMGVVTNALFPGTMFVAKAAELGLAGYFEAVVSSADAGASKPHPDIYRRALAGLPAAPTETLFVGDRVDTDVAGALALGMPAALIARRGSPPESPEFAVVEHLSGVNGILGVNPVTAIDRPTPG